MKLGAVKGDSITLDKGRLKTARCDEPFEVAAAVTSYVAFLPASRARPANERLAVQMRASSRFAPGGIPVAVWPAAITLRSTATEGDEIWWNNPR